MCVKFKSGPMFQVAYALMEFLKNNEPKPVVDGRQSLSI